MLYLLVWWGLVVLLGLAAFPVAFRFFRCLPDRGYPFVKPLALLLVAYPFWLLTSLGLLQNTFGAIALLVVLLAGLAWGYGLWRGETESPWRWLRANWRHILAVEAVFTIAFLGFAYYRGFNPEIQATEKPMEFMFLNSILKSPTFPPHDSWLSGYAISYYYLGYVIVALLTRLTAVPSSDAFNLALTLIYALAATGAFGLVYNLARWAQDQKVPQGTRPGGWSPYLAGILAALLLLVAGNLEAPFESLHNAGIGSADLYQWLDINGLASAPRSGTLQPTDNWWWWRASRVVNDHSPVNGDHMEVIDEFPAFSFLLGDLHPHVLALPFGLMALAVAFNLFLLPVRRTPSLAAALSRWREPGPLFDSLAEVTRPWLTPAMLLTALIAGSLSMLNTWDIATYGFIIIAAFALAQFSADGAWSLDGLLKSAFFGIGLLAVGYILYLPFYMGFTSQAGGILPNTVFKTPLQQYLMMFGLFILILTGFILALVWRANALRRALLSEIGTWVSSFFLLPLLIAGAGALVLFVSADLRGRVVGLLGVANGEPGSTVLQVLRMYATAFAYSLALFLLLTCLMSAIIVLARRWLDRREEHAVSNSTLHSSLNPAIIFALLLAFTGLLLTFGVEFLYIRDTFGTRMNTVFKLYFQAWTLFSMAASFGVYYIWQNTRGVGRGLYLGAVAIVVWLSLFFPAMAYPDRANEFKPNANAGIPTLDGMLWVKNGFPDDYAAIDWLNAHASRDAVILESAGRSYSFDDRVSMATGLPTVVGWTGHELQWRGSGDETARREADVEKIYSTQDQAAARELLAKYGVQYVIVGSVERERYKLTPQMIDKFSRLGKLVFSQGSMRLYQLNP